MHALYGLCTMLTFVFGLLTFVIILELRSTGGFWVHPSRWRADVREHLVCIATGLIVVALVTGVEIWLAPAGEWPTASILGVSISIFLGSCDVELDLQARISRQMFRLRMYFSGWAK